MDLWHRLETHEPEGSRERLPVRLAAPARAESAGPERESMRHSVFQKSGRLEKIDTFEAADSERRRFQTMLSAGTVELSAFSYWRSSSSGFMPLSMCAQGRTSSRGFWRWM